MSKRTWIIGVIAVLMLVGGFFGVRQYLDSQAHQQYLRSADRMADDFIRLLKSQDSANAMALYSTDLRANYSPTYWSTVFFPQFKDYKDNPTLHSKGPVQPASAATPNPYDPVLHQDAQNYEYDFRLHEANYRVSLVIFRQENQWRINELRGAYLP